MLLQKYRDSNGKRIVMQSCGLRIASDQQAGILMRKSCDTNGTRIAILFKCKDIAVRGRCDSLEVQPNWVQPAFARFSQKVTDFGGCKEWQFSKQKGSHVAAT